MRMAELRLISFRQTPEEQEFVYGLADRKPLWDEYLYMKHYGAFGAIQKVLHGRMLEYTEYPVVEATNNPKYDLPRLPMAVVDNYLTDKTNNKVTLRLPDLNKD